MNKLAGSEPKKGTSPAKKIKIIKKAAHKEGGDTAQKPQI